MIEAPPLVGGYSWICNAPKVPWRVWMSVGARVSCSRTPSSPGVGKAWRTCRRVAPTVAAALCSRPMAGGRLQKLECAGPGAGKRSQHRSASAQAWRRAPRPLGWPSGVAWCAGRLCLVLSLSHRGQSSENQSGNPAMVDRCVAVASQLWRMMMSCRDRMHLLNTMRQHCLSPRFVGLFRHLHSSAFNF